MPNFRLFGIELIIHALKGVKEINKKLFLINDNSYWKKFNELLDYFKLKHFTSNNYENHNLTTCNLQQLKKEIKRIDAKNKS